MESKKCDICQEEKKETYITILRLKLGVRMGSRIGDNYIEPIDLNVCYNCKEHRKQDIINKFKSLLPSE